MTSMQDTVRFMEALTQLTPAERGRLFTIMKMVESGELDIQSKEGYKRAEAMLHGNSRPRVTRRAVAQS